LEYNFKQYLEEGRDAPLYHGTLYVKAKQILESDSILANTEENINKAERKTKGVSLTRNYNLAIKFVDAKYGSLSPIIFELDQRKLAQRYRIVPHNYYTTNDTISNYDIKDAPTRFTKETPGDFNEFEEFVIGDIKPLSRYLTKIHVANEGIYKSIGINAKEIYEHPLLWDHKNKRFYNKGK